MKNESRSLVSDSLRPHGLDSPWSFPGQNTGVGSLSLLQGILELPYDPAIQLLGLHPEKTIIQKDTWTLQCSWQHRLQKPGHESNLNVHQQQNG